MGSRVALPVQRTSIVIFTLRHGGQEDKSTMDGNEREIQELKSWRQHSRVGRCVYIYGAQAERISIYQQHL